MELASCADVICFQKDVSAGVTGGFFHKEWYERSKFIFISFFQQPLLLSDWCVAHLIGRWGRVTLMSKSQLEGQLKVRPRVFCFMCVGSICKRSSQKSTTEVRVPMFTCMPEKSIYFILSEFLQSSLHFVFSR